MQQKISFSIKSLIISSLMLIAVFFAAIAWAQSNGDDPEGGVIPVAHSSDANNDAVQDTQDVPVPTGSNPEGEMLPATNQSIPVSEGGAEMQLAPDAPSQVVTLYKFIAGSNFHSREATTTYNYGNAGCLYRTSTSGYLVSDLQMPQGAEIDLVSLYFNDTNVNYNAEVWLYAYDGLGGFTEITHVASIGTPGQTSADSAIVSHIVDNSVESLGVVVGTGSANDSSVRICGVRVRYHVDVPSYIMLPTIFND